MYRDKEANNYKNELRMSKRNNVEMEVRNKYGKNSHINNLKRTMMEREFERDSRDSNIGDGNTIGKKKYYRHGEITGEDINKKDLYDKGMPMRSQYTIKKSSFNENRHLDFELFDENESDDDLDVNYFDPGGGFSDLNMSMKTISSQVQSKTICSDGIELIGFQIFDNMVQMMTNSFVINACGLYSIFGSIYSGCKGNSEIELKDFFSYPKRELLLSGLNEISNKLNSINAHARFANLILFADELSVNEEYYKCIRDISFIKKIDITEINKECFIINKFVNNQLGLPSDLRTNIIVPDNLFNLNVILVTTAYISPIWAQLFETIRIGRFNNRKIEYMVTRGKTFGFYEDNDIKLLELKCAGDKLTMGIVMKKNDIVDINEENLHNFIQNMKGTILEEVSIPMFKIKSKIRYTNIMKKMGMKLNFMLLDMPELFDDDCKIDDVIQNVQIEITNKYSGLKETNSGYKTLKKFVVDTTFMYYFRFIPTNTIILFGVYV